jgi:hypothetical protein
VALILACLCMVGTTAVAVYAVLSLGQALSRVGDQVGTPVPDYSCDPTYEVC